MTHNESLSLHLKYEQTFGFHSAEHSFEMFFPVNVATNYFAQNLNHLVKSTVKLLQLIIHIFLFFYAGGSCQMETSLFVAVGILN